MTFSQGFHSFYLQHLLNLFYVWQPLSPAAYIVPNLTIHPSQQYSFAVLQTMEQLKGGRQVQPAG
jgi:hypothetical protein